MEHSTGTPGPGRPKRSRQVQPSPVVNRETSEDDELLSSRAKRARRRDELRHSSSVKRGTAMTQQVPVSTISTEKHRSKRPIPAPVGESVAEIAKREGKDETTCSLNVMAAESSKIHFTLNEKPIEVENPDPQQLLVHWLRESGYTGTKLSCGQGGCGACTVNIRSWSTPSTDYIAVNACLRPLAAVHEMDVLTVEGLGSCTTTPKHLNAVQEKIAIFNGSQCGYCTPGFVMGMNAYLNHTPLEQRTLVDIENLFDGHLCRCTGYRPILCGMKTFAYNGNREELKHTPQLIQDTEMSYSVGKTQHRNVAVVPEFVDTPTVTKLVSKRRDSIWYGLQTLNQLWDLLQKYETDREYVRLVAGNTVYGIQIFQEFIRRQSIMLFIGRIPDLTELKYDDEKIVARCAVPIQQLWNLMQSLSRAHIGNDQHSTYPPAIAYKHWRRLATTEIRNVASIAGNLYIAKVHGFTSDLFIVLATLGATVTVASKADHGLSKRVYSMMEFLQKRDILTGTNIIYEVTIPIKPRENVFIDTYKVSSRPQNSHPLVNAGFSMKIAESKFQEVKIFYGNSKGPQEMILTERLVEDICTPSNLHESLPKIFHALEKELIKEDKPSHSYDTDTACNIFFKYLMKMACTFKLPGWSDIKHMHSASKSLVNWRLTVASSGQQDFCVYRDEFPVSEPIVKNSAFLQTTGEAKYTQDMGRQTHHLNGVYILNIGKDAQAYANFEISIPPSFKKTFPYVIRVFTAQDFQSLDQPEQGQGVHSRNNMGPGQAGFCGDTIFAQNEVLYIGQPLGMVIAKTQEAAREAAEWLQDHAVTYDSKPQGGIVTLEEAMKRKSYFYDKSMEGHRYDAPSRLLKISRPKSLSKIDWKIFEDNQTMVIVEGSQRAASQYHFYMETQSAIAFPTEQGGIKLYASTQSPKDVQAKVAKVCNLPMNQVTIEISRLGGGYGGKEVQSKFVAAAAAFCAQQLKQPVRVANYRVEDMHMIGKRHAFIGHFKLAATKDGKIEAMQIHFYSDGGCTYDATFPVMDLALLSSDNAYYVPKFLAEGDCAMTNKASSTAFRSFGVIQTMLIVEAGIEALAEKMNITEEQLRERNFYQQNQFTPYGQQLLYCNLQNVWDTIKDSSSYEERKKAVQEFNRNSVCKKRGIKLIPLKYGISFTNKSFNQGSAIINVYATDGTVLLSHGGVEMGQGLNTKMMQIAALHLNIPMEMIRIPANSTEKIANAVSTGASTGSDLNGGAVKDACIKLRESLESLLKSQADKSDSSKSELLQHWKKYGSWYKPGGKNYWKDVVKLAYENRVSLSSNGYYKSPDLTTVTNDNPVGRPFYYFNYAAAVSEVEIDALTGEFTILRSDIVYDAGHSLNPAIDVGQVEGGFVMGIGNVTTEELIFDDHGRLLTDGTWEYKPPCPKSIPKDLRVTLYPGTKHKQLSRPKDRVCHVTSKIEDHVKIDPHGIQSSKTTGEPPLVLANSVFFAIKQAVAEARREVGLTDSFNFDAPATVKRIQQACAFKPVHIAQLTKSAMQHQKEH